MRINSIKTIVVLFSLEWILFSGCTTVKRLSIEVLVPPETLVYPGLQSATLISRNALIGNADSLFNRKPDSLLIDTAFRQAIMNESLRGFRELLEVSPGIDTIIQDTAASELISRTAIHSEASPDFELN